MAAGQPEHFMSVSLQSQLYFWEFNPFKTAAAAVPFFFDDLLRHTCDIGKNLFNLH